MTAMTAEDVDPFALLTAKEAAGYARLSVQAICNWYSRGHLAAAKDAGGNEITDSRGKRLYYLVDVARADAKMAAQRERMALRILASSAALASVVADRGPGLLPPLVRDEDGARFAVPFDDGLLAGGVGRVDPVGELLAEFCGTHLLHVRSVPPVHIVQSVL